MSKPLLKEREELISSIALISKQMMGPLPNIERAWLHEDRKEMRARLAEIDAMLAERSKP